MSRPEKNTAYTSSFAVINFAARAFLYAWVKVTGEEPAVYGYWVGWIVSAGKALNGSAGSPAAKPVMN